MAVSVFCTVWELETPTPAVFSNIFICLHPKIDVVIPWRRPMKLIMLHYTDMGTQLS